MATWYNFIILTLFFWTVIEQIGNLFSVFRFTACSSWYMRWFLEEIPGSLEGSLEIVGLRFLLMIWNSWRPFFTSLAFSYICWITQVSFPTLYWSWFMLQLLFKIASRTICSFPALVTRRKTNLLLSCAIIFLSSKLGVIMFAATVAFLSDLGFLWYREFYLESSRVIQV